MEINIVLISEHSIKINKYCSNKWTSQINIVYIVLISEQK